MGRGEAWLRTLDMGGGKNGVGAGGLWVWGVMGEGPRYGWGPLWL